MGFRSETRRNTAYARFYTRRGVCARLYSDNAMTYRGAATELKQMFMETSDFVKGIAGQLALQGTQWSFVPPRTPHFGDFWEAAVKSFKCPFNKIIGDTKIEACLNSRPLCPIRSEPSEPAALTLGHFLMGSSCLSPPEPIHLSNKWNCANARRLSPNYVTPFGIDGERKCYTICNSAINGSKYSTTFNSETWYS